MEPDFKVGIIGAGFAGLVAALKLKEEGQNSFVIFERASEIGGTWRDNNYPGCACDIAVHLYSFAAVPNPDWSNLYAGQREILQYLKDVTCKKELQQHIRLNADIVEARFNPEEAFWRLTDSSGMRTNVSILLLAMGPLNRPFIPSFKGLDQFNGSHFHTSQWDVNFNPADKSVAVIGTGASAIQVVPNLAPLVKTLLVYQRTPAWVTDRFDKKISHISKKLFTKFPAVQSARRELIYWVNEFFGLGFLGSNSINHLMAWNSLRKLKKEIKDPHLRKKLTPTYKIGCKRILKSDDFYPTFNRSNVTLLTEEIEQFTPTGILTKDGAFQKLDAVVFATGFVAADFDMYIQIFGLDGRNLIDEWNLTGAEAYLGTTVSGFPNLGLLLGPNTGVGHNSIVHMIESQMAYIMQYIKRIERLDVGQYLDVKIEMQRLYNDIIQTQLKKTVWASGCRSWYMNAQGKNTTLYPGLTTTFRKVTRRFDLSVYDAKQYLPLNHHQ